MIEGYSYGSSAIGAKASSAKVHPANESKSVNGEPRDWLTARRTGVRGKSAGWSFFANAAELESALTDLGSVTTR